MYIQHILPQAFLKHGGEEHRRPQDRLSSLNYNNRIKLLIDENFVVFYLCIEYKDTMC